MIAHVRPLLRNGSPHLLIVLTHLRQAHHLNLMKLVIHTLHLNKALNITHLSLSINTESLNALEGSWATFGIWSFTVGFHVIFKVVENAIKVN